MTNTLLACVRTQIHNAERAYKFMLKKWLLARGLSIEYVDQLIPLIPDDEPEFSFGWFYTEELILNPDRWFYWPNQTRFVLVGQCCNGDGVALDTDSYLGTTLYHMRRLIILTHLNIV
jgi:hypothetical protein